MNVIQCFKEKAKNADFIVVTISTVISSVASFLYTIFARRYVLPLEYGIYSTCLLVQTYMSYAQLGVLNAYNRDYPQLLGAGEIEKSKKLKNTAFTFFVGCYCTCFIGIAAVISVLFIRGEIVRQYYFGYLVIMLVLIVGTIADFGINSMRMNGGYNYTSAVAIIRTVIGCGVGLLCIGRFGYYGLYVLPLLSAAIAIVLCYKGAFKGIRIAIDRAILRDSLSTGMPLMVNSLVWTAVASVDKFVILGFMDTEMLGIYSVAQLGFAMMVLVPQSMSQVFYFKISTAYGKSGDKMELVNLGNRYTLLNAVCSSAMCATGYYVLPIFVRIVMPNYTDGISAAQIIFMGIAIYGSTMLYGNIFSVLRMNRELLWTSVLLCFFNIIFSVGLVLLRGRHIDNVAMGTATSYAAFSIVMIWILARKFHVKIGDFCKAAWIPVLVMIVPPVVLYDNCGNLYVAFACSIIYVILILIWYWKKFGNGNERRNN